MMVELKRTVIRAPRILRMLAAAAVAKALPWPTIKAIASLRQEAWLITGCEAHSHSKERIAFCGSDVDRHFWAHLIFGDDYEEKRAGKKWLWEMARAGSAPVSMLVAAAPGKYINLTKKQNSFFIPGWVNGQIDIPDLSKISRLEHRDNIASDIRRIRKYRLSYDVSRSEEDFLEFYNEMYLPFIPNRHGKVAVVMKKDSMRSIFRKGELLFVSSGGRRIAGLLLSYNRRKAYQCLHGIRQGNADYVKMGAQAALYYFSLVYLKEKGYQKTDMGQSRPFLNDGVLRYKKKWGLYIIGDTGVGYLVRIMSNTLGVTSCLINNPFIFKNRRGYSGAVFIGGNEPLDDEARRRIWSEYHYPGLRDICVYRLGEAKAQDSRAAFWELVEVISIHSQAATP